MLRIVDRYLGREILVSTFFAVCVLNIVLVLGEIFRRLFGYIINHNVPMTYIVTIIVSFLPAALVYSIPWGFLTAVLLIFGRLSSTNELTALRTAGLSVARVARPVLILAALASALCLWIDLYVAPRFLQNLQAAFVQMATSDPSSAFTGDQVIDEFPGRKIFIGHKTGNRLENIRVFELDENSKPVRVVFAKTGTLETDGEHKQIVMNLDGSRVEQRDYQQPGDLTKIRDGNLIGSFSLVIPLDELFTKKQGRRKPESYTFDELRAEFAARHLQLAADREMVKATRGKQASLVDSNDKEQQATANAEYKQARAVFSKDTAQLTAIGTELNKRFSFSFACVTFALVGIPLGITAQRQETSAGFALSLLVALSYFLIIIVVNAFRDKAHVHPELLIWLPNAIFLVLALLPGEPALIPLRLSRGRRRAGTVGGCPSACRRAQNRPAAGHR